MAKVAFDACTGDAADKLALKKVWRSTTYRFRAYDSRVMGYLLEDPTTAFVPTCVYVIFDVSKTSLSSRQL